MPTVTIEDVREVTQTSLADAIITANINMLISRSGSCLDASYPQSEADIIALYAVSGMVDIADQSSKVKSERAANGASTTYQDVAFNAKSFAENQFGSQATAWDYNGCLAALFPLAAGVRVSGQSARVCR